MTTATQQQQQLGWPTTREFPLVLHLEPAVRLSEDQFFDMCQLNRDLRIERTAEGDVLLMPPAGGETGASNAGITAQVWQWTKQDGTGTTFDSSAGFMLPSGAVRSPDASWIARSRWDALTPKQRKRFAPICPDFVLELRSPSDALADLHAKLAEYLANGARLGWLLDPEARRVFVYRPDAPLEQLDDPATVAGDPVLPDFVLDLRAVW